MKNRNGRFPQLQPLFTTVKIDGTPVQIKPDSIPLERRTVCHGDYNGVKVNSPAFTKIGDSTITWDESGKSLTMRTPAAVLLAKGVLESEGFQVTKAGAGS